MVNPFIGQITLFAGNFAPRSFAFCEGQLMSIAQNSALFSILGTTYGGDGRTTFALPDLRGRAPVNPRRGPGLSEYRLGERGGTEEVTLNILNLPNHHHFTTTSGGGENVVMSSIAGVRDTPEAGDVMAVASFGPGISATKVNAYGPPTSPVISQTLSPTVLLGNAGGSQSHENRKPFLALNYIIALFGVYPSRG